MPRVAAAESPWGRIADDGTVYLKTASGERVIGSWQAGEPAEGLAFYRRRYEDLEAEVGILEARVAATTADPRTVGTAARKLQETLAEAPVLGDIGAVERRLAAVLEAVEGRMAERATARAAASAAAADRKRALVEEAKQLAAGNEWRAAGERFRAIVDEWKTIRGVDRKTDSELWGEFAGARKQFDRRRREHFAALEKQREDSATRKEALVAEAEKLSASEDWGPTARRFKDLMSQWKTSGRASRESEDELWQRFKQAQDTFFGNRSAAFSVRDAELAKNLEVKEALLAEAERLDPSSDLDGARKRLRTIHTKWDDVGHVPRDKEAALEARLAAVERRVRDAGATVRPTSIPESPLIVRLRESVTKLEARLERARSSGDERLATETETALETQRAWLDQAEASVR
jgi:hypothetical protein